jgi:hypothetical protein
MGLGHLYRQIDFFTYKGWFLKQKTARRSCFSFYSSLTKLSVAGHIKAKPLQLSFMVWSQT